MKYLDELIHAFDGEELVLADLGGTFSFWEMNLKHLEYVDRITRIDIYNLEIDSESRHTIGQVEVVENPGDVTRLDNVAENQYDVAFSNSVIEHVGNLHQQQRFAREMQRIASGYVMQTPNRFFPVEPHFYVPFFPFIPLSIRTWMHRRLRLGWFVREPDELQARIDCDSIRLLTRRELSLLFPEAAIHAEWLGGLIKSFIVTGRDG